MIVYAVFLIIFSCTDAGARPRQTVNINNARCRQMIFLHFSYIRILMQYLQSDIIPSMHNAHVIKNHAIIIIIIIFVVFC